MKLKDLLYDWTKIRREILLQWNNASTNSPFDPEDLRDLRSMTLNESDDDSIVINKYYKLNVYRKLNPGDKYIVSVDPAKGRGDKADRTVVCVTDAKTDRCCAIFKSSVIQYKETYRFLYTLIYKYIPNSVIVVENNIDTLIEYLKNSPMRHLVYYEPTSSVTKETRKKGVLKKKDTSNIVYGITTTSQNRPKYFDILFEYIESHLVIHSVSFQRSDIVVITVVGELEGLMCFYSIDRYSLPLCEFICREIIGVFLIRNIPYRVIGRVVSQKQKAMIRLVWWNFITYYGVEVFFVTG